MGAKIRMSQLQPGDKAIVTKLTIGGAMRRRLQDIGLIEGTGIECVGKSPLGDPAAFMIRQAVIALRREDADRIEIKVVNG